MKTYQIFDCSKKPQLTEVDTPTPGAHQVRVRTYACGLNFADLLMQEGKYQEKPDLPFAPGMEIAGVVDAVGADTSGVKVGDRIAAFGGYGGLAEYTVVDADRCVAIPDAMPMDHAAAFIVAYGTSHVALTRRGRLKKGETLVVTGAAGGVGITAVELGAKMGARVVAIARGAAKLEVAQQAGAHHVIDADASDLRDQLKALGGLDVLYDTVGGSLFDACFRAARPEARLIVIGFAGGEVPLLKANHLLVKNIEVIGYYWGGYMAFAPSVLSASLSELLEMYTAGQISPHISHTLPLEAAEEAYDLLRSRRSTGKVVVTLAD